MILIGTLATLVAALAPWLWIRAAAGPHVHELSAGTEQAEAALVLGTLVRPDGTLSPRLAERVDVAIALYEAGAVPLLIMSGTPASDTAQNEPERMHDYAVERGVPPEAIALDPRGVDTYASCGEAAGTFGLQRVIVVTNEFHTYRAAWLCRDAGLDATGVHAPPSPSATTFKGNVREIAAAWKAIADAA